LWFAATAVVLKLVVIAAKGEDCRFSSRAVSEVVLYLPLADLRWLPMLVHGPKPDFAGAEKSFVFVPG
jgi:hypothetical protein